MGFEDVQEATLAALRAFFKIGRDWGLSADEEAILLGGPSQAVLSTWRDQSGNAIVPRDTLERISYILGIHESLHAQFRDRQRADAWVRKPNEAPIFGGGTALDRMLAGNVCDIYVVRKYLDLIVGAGV